MGSAIKLRLPHPYLTTYEISPRVVPSGLAPTDCEEVESQAELLQIRRIECDKSSLPTLEPPEILHTADFTFTAPSPPAEGGPPVADNTAWARSRRSLKSRFRWTKSPPSIGQLWLAIYALFTLRPELEQIRVSLEGPQSEKVGKELMMSMLATSYPAGPEETIEGTFMVLLLRATFWQGAGSPFGDASVWMPLEESRLARPFVLDYTLTSKFPHQNVHTWHPRRNEKPRPGSVIYSRYIPHLDEQFSMVAIDWQDSKHLDLFHTWQNDPRVAQGWNESGDLEHHRSYLRRMHEDPHQIAILAYFESTPFAYFEVYWAKEDHMGAYYPAGDFDRGRHSLVGDVRYRGRHRVTAWWSSLIHYLFLDDPRTMVAVGEPKATSTSVLEYDLMTGFGLEKFIDLPHKRSAFMVCSRERFFQLSPLDARGGFLGGTNVVIAARL